MTADQKLSLLRPPVAPKLGTKNTGEGLPFFVLKTFVCLCHIKRMITWKLFLVVRCCLCLMEITWWTQELQWKILQSSNMEGLNQDEKPIWNWNASNRCMLKVCIGHYFAHSKKHFQPKFKEPYPCHGVPLPMMHFFVFIFINYDHRRWKALEFMSCFNTRIQTLGDIISQNVLNLQYWFAMKEKHN